jgi:hypothetical protein
MTCATASERAEPIVWGMCLSRSGRAMFVSARRNSRLRQCRAPMEASPSNPASNHPTFRSSADSLPAHARLPALQLDEPEIERISIRPIRAET